MATTRKTKAKKAADRKTAKGRTARRTRESETISAIELLEDDHREVEGFFAEYEDLEDEAAKAELAAKICLALTVHTHIEEEIFYPAARKATEDDDLLDEAAVEHAGAKHLIAEIEGMEAGDALYDAKIRVLGEQIKHHVKEEEEELFPEIRRAKMEIEALGRKMAARKAELMAQLSGESGAEGAIDFRKAAGNKPAAKPRRET
jgi:hemerythrin superfamily protein